MAEQHGHHHHHHHHHHDAHDWHSASYVDEWVASDNTRREKRNVVLKQMLEAGPSPKDREYSILDIGAGTGEVTLVALQVFPKARITLQDYSDEMLSRARARFTKQAGQLSYVRCDLSDLNWAKQVGGPFDFAISGIAIHNLRELPAMGAVYRGVRSVVKPGGLFLDCDHFHRVGGPEAHADLMRQAGFAQVETLWQDERSATLKAR